MPIAIKTLLQEDRCFEPPADFAKRARIGSRARYDELYRESIEDPDTFWRRETEDLVFRERWSTTVEWSVPNAKWFLGAKLNITESCLDRHLDGPRRHKAALIWEGENADEVRTLTYAQLHRETELMAHVLRELGVQKGDRVAIYMGMVPEAAIAMLACARIGAVHTVVFGGFAPDALKDRIVDCQAKLVITQDAGWRRGKVLPLKSVVDTALSSAEAACVEHTLVYRRVGDEAAITMREGRDQWWHELRAKADVARSSGSRDTGASAVVDGEHPLFILYTSGSTGRPKGVLHTTAGYLVGTYITTKYVFDLRDDDVYWCTADVGWITGHSYIVYGPLAMGATCLMYEGAPNYPDWGRFWHIVERHGVGVLYTAPTAIRAFMRAGDEWPQRYDLSSLRLLGTVGEPINPEAWMWYRRIIGADRCPIVDTWWQTETGSIMITTLPGAAAAKPGSAGLPMFGVVPAVVDSDGNDVGKDAGGLLVLRQPWPSMIRTIWGDDERFQKQYFSTVEQNYFSGDGARYDEDGYIWVVGRIDDVLNVSGHRIGTAEIESALVSHEAVVEAAAVGRPDELKGQALVVFVTPTKDSIADEKLADEVKAHVAAQLGKFTQPDEVHFAEALPKTRSGKIMRRLLKDVAQGRESTGDMSTLEDFSVLAKLRNYEE